MEQEVEVEREEWRCLPSASTLGGSFLFPEHRFSQKYEEAWFFRAPSTSAFPEFPRVGLLILTAVSPGGRRLSFGGRSLESRSRFYHRGAGSPCGFIVKILRIRPGVDGPCSSDISGHLRGHKDDDPIPLQPSHLGI